MESNSNITQEDTPTQKAKTIMINWYIKNNSKAGSMLSSNDLMTIFMQADNETLDAMEDAMDELMSDGIVTDGESGLILTEKGVELIIK